MFISDLQNVMFLILSIMFFLLQNLRTGGWHRICLGGQLGIGVRSKVTGKGVKG
jgi:hypothetical protein